MSAFGPLGSAALAQRWTARGAGAWLSLCATILPSVAAACPVCFQATEQNRLAFIGTTIFLSLLPLAAIGGLVFWLVRRARSLDQPPPAAEPNGPGGDPLEQARPG